MNNNIFLGSDPLLGGNPLQNQYQIDYNQQIAQLEAAKQQLVQQAPRISKSPIWDEIDKEVDSLTDSEISALNKSEEYQQSNNAVQSILNREFMKIMRPIVESSPEGKNILEKHLTLVRRLRKSAHEEASKNMELFREYTEHHSDMTYAEFLKMKAKKK